MGWRKIRRRSQDVAQTLGVRCGRKGREGNFADVLVGRREAVRDGVLLLRTGVPGVEIFNAAGTEVSAGGAFVQLDGRSIGRGGFIDVAGTKLRVAEESFGFC